MCKRCCVIDVVYFWRQVLHSAPANTRRWTNVGLLLGQRRRRWPNSKPALGRSLVLRANFVHRLCSQAHPSLPCLRTPPGFTRPLHVVWLTGSQRRWWRVQGLPWGLPLSSRYTWQRAWLPVGGFDVRHARCDVFCDGDTQSIRIRLRSGFMKARAERTY